MNESVLLPVVLASLAALAGCSSDSEDPFGDEPDHASVQQRFTSPSGSFDTRNAISVFTRYADERRSSQELDIAGATSLGGASVAGGTSGVRSQALHLLDLAESGSPTQPRCSSLDHGATVGTCACPGGGSFTYDFSAFRAMQQSPGSLDAALKVRFDRCSAQDASLDGREFVRLHAERPAGNGRVDRSSFSMLLVVSMKATRAGKSHAVELAASIDKGQLEMALQVDDGWITVRAASGDGANGTFVVRDRNGTWTCDVGDGKGTCKNDRGETRTF